MQKNRTKYKILSAAGKIYAENWSSFFDEAVMETLFTAIYAAMSMYIIEFSALLRYWQKDT